MTLFRALRHRPFALLWSGQAISRLGDSLYNIALAWWVLQATGSAAAMGTVLIFSFAPLVLFLLVGGVAVDRLPRLRVMFVTDLASGIVVLAVAALASLGRLEVWHVYIASMLFGFMQAFFFPAYNAVVPDLTPAEALPSANSLTNLSQQLAGVAGPALGAVIVATRGAPAAFALDGLSFLISAGCLLTLVRQAEPPRQTRERTSVWRDLREGIGVVMAVPWLWINIVLFGLTNVTLTGPRAVALPFLVRNNLHANVGTLGFVYSAGATGAVVGAIWLGGLKRIRRRGPLAYGATVLSGLAGVLIGLAPVVAVTATAAFVIGLCISVFSLIWTNTLQEMVPREKLGRVNSIDALGSFVLLPLGFGLAGWSTDRLGAPLVFILGGGVTVLLTLAAWLHPAIRALD